MAWHRIDLDELIDQQVRAVIMAGGVQFEIGESVAHTLRIESRFQVADSSGSVSVAWASGDTESVSGLGKVGSTFGSAVSNATAEEDGSLTISFSNGVFVSVPVDKDYEAWTLSGPSGVLSSPPGGPLG